MRMKVLTAAAALALAAGAAAWWYSPTGVAFRYRQSDLVSLWQTARAHPKDFAAWKELGMRLARQGDELAAQPLSEAYKLDPNDGEVATALAEIYSSQQHVSEAFQILRAETEHSPDFIPARLALGKLYQKKGSYHHAAEQYEHVVKIDSNNAPAWHQLAICYLQMQESARAREAILNARKLQPGEPTYMALHGTIDTVTGKVDEGLTNLFAAAKAAPDNPQVQGAALTALLTYHRGPEDLQRAKEILDRLSERNPSSPKLMFQRGELARLNGNFDEAARLLEGARQAAPEMDDIYYSLSRTYERLGRQQEADKMLAEYRRRKDLRLRIEETRIAIGEHTEDPVLHKKLAELALKAGDVRGAIDALQTASQLDPNDTLTKSRLAALNNIARRSGSSQ